MVCRKQRNPDDGRQQTRQPGLDQLSMVGSRVAGGEERPLTSTKKNIQASRTVNRTGRRNENNVTKNEMGGIKSKHAILEIQNDETVSANRKGT